MKSFSGYFKTIILIFSILPLMADSCNDNENTGYHSIAIPGYDITDYYSMLQSSNEEIQYNAICNLWSLSKVELLETDSLKTTPEYITAQKVYTKIYSMMSANNSWVSSAAIRYVGRFKYNRKNFISYTLNNTNPSVNVQLAIWTAWKNNENDEIADSALLIKKTIFCLQHPSWLIQQSAYDYITPATSHFFEDRLISMFDSTKEQYKKLLLVQTLNNHLCDTIFSFFTYAYTSTTDTSVQQSILLSLANALNRQQVLDWFTKHKKETAFILNHGFIFSGKENDFYPQLVLVGLQQGWNPAKMKYDTEENENYPLLYYYIFKNKYLLEYNEANPDSINPKQTADCKKIEQQLLADNRWRNEWLNYEKTHFRYSLPAQLVKEQQQLTAKFIKNIKLLFYKHQIDSTAYKNFLVQLDNNSKEFYRSRLARKPAR